MIHTKRVIFMILPLLFVPLVYGMSSTPDACAVPPDSNWGPSKTCGQASENAAGHMTKTCCWTETERGPYPKIGTTEVRYCQTCSVTPEGTDCKPKVAQRLQSPSGILEDLPTLEQVPATTPPLFGENDANIPPTTGGIVEQPPAAPTQPAPGGVPSDQEPEEQPTTPQDDQQDDNQGGVLPNIQNRPNIVPDSEITAKPEDEEPQDEQQEGAETAGPLT